MTRGLRCQPDVLEATQLRLAGRVTARQVVPLKAKTQVGLHATHLPQPAHHITELAGGGTAHLRMFQLPHDSFSLRNSVLYNAALSLRTLARPATSTGNLPILLFQDLRKFSRVYLTLGYPFSLVRHGFSWFSYYVPLVLLLVRFQWLSIAPWRLRAGPSVQPCAWTRGSRRSMPTSSLLQLTGSVDISRPTKILSSTP